MNKIKQDLTTLALTGGEKNEVINPLSIAQIINTVEIACVMIENATLEKINNRNVKLD